MALRHREHQGAPLPTESVLSNSLLQREKVASERETDEVYAMKRIKAALFAYYGEDSIHLAIYNL